MLQIQRKAKLLAHAWRRMLKRPQRLVVFILIADIDDVEVLEAVTQFQPFAGFGCVGLKAPQRSDIAFPTDYAVANQTRACFAAYEAVDLHSSCHRADFPASDDFAPTGLADNL